MSVNQLWLQYNKYSNKLHNELGRTSNIVGEYAEYLTHQYYGGNLLTASASSADLEVDGKRYQIKSRKINKTNSTQLGVIRSWDFDFLVVVLFDINGGVKQSLEVPVELAKEYGKWSQHQNGCIITTNSKFLNDNRFRDITTELSSKNNG